MHLLPTQEDVVGVLRESGALREGHFEDPRGLHSNEYLQVSPPRCVTTNTSACYR